MTHEKDGGIQLGGIAHDDHYYPYFGRRAAADGDAGDGACQSIDSAQLSLAQPENRDIPERPRDGGEHAAGGDQQNSEVK